MATFDYASTAEDVIEALAEAGDLIYVSRNDGTGEGVYDPETSTVVDATQDATRAAGAIQMNLEWGSVDGTLIHASDSRWMIAPDLGMTPKAGDTVTWQNERFVIVVCKPFAPAGIPLFYDVIARG